MAAMGPIWPSMSPMHAAPTQAQSVISASTATWIPVSPSARWSGAATPSACNSAQVDGITGASVGAGRKLKITLNLQDALFDAGYTLHIDAAAENMRESPDDVVLPLTSDAFGKSVSGRRYINSVTVAN